LFGNGFIYMIVLVENKIIDLHRKINLQRDC